MRNALENLYYFLVGWFRCISSSDMGHHLLFKEVPNISCQIASHVCERPCLYFLLELDTGLSNLFGDHVNGGFLFN